MVRAIIKAVGDYSGFLRKARIDEKVKNINIICGVISLADARLICDDNGEITFFFNFRNSPFSAGQKSEILGFVKMTRIFIERSVTVEKNRSANPP